ncbi:hypothetical protein QBC32DRAFT_332141 [Pseudoneurospora amorphoporcata]|uniref:DUF7053 domain-containing protein n=1 Tax=Pseudoneurospora amorphoporcata TaxID=241081 RepID=A0AAN6SJS7_9PEZI|nr:hypothetical protein QBC32DRAFT_332141 [Pseudoneurospora amorphoporcata]
MSLLSTKAQLLHKSPIPPKTTREQAIELLQDHEFLLSCDPHLAKCEPLTPSTPPTIPSAVQPRVLRRDQVLQGHRCYPHAARRVVGQQRCQYV